MASSLYYQKKIYKILHVMITEIKFQILDFVQEVFLQFLILREKIKRIMNPNPRSFWDL